MVNEFLRRENFKPLIPTLFKDRLEIFQYKHLSIKRHLIFGVAKLLMIQAKHFSQTSMRMKKGTVEIFP
jgi:hypothetical protein